MAGPGNFYEHLDCGDWTGLFNAVLGLPGTAHSELVVTLTGEAGEHPQFL